MEDLVEEIVGEISDEYDIVTKEIETVREGNTSLMEAPGSRS